MKVLLITHLVIARRRTNPSHTSSSWDMERLTSLLTGATRLNTSTNPAPMEVLNLNFGPAAWKHQLPETRLWTVVSIIQFHKNPKGHIVVVDR